MRPSLALNLKRSAVREATSRFRVANLRVFGSVLHGTDLDGSDLDVVWETTQEWLPGLLEQLLVVCRGEGTDNHDEVES